MYVRAATISGTTFTFGTAAEFMSAFWSQSALQEGVIGFDESVKLYNCLLFLF